MLTRQGRQQPCETAENCNLIIMDNNKQVCGPQWNHVVSSLMTRVNKKSTPINQQPSNGNDAKE
jgi:hypothetical protein